MCSDVRWHTPSRHGAVNLALAPCFLVLTRLKALTTIPPLFQLKEVLSLVSESESENHVTHIPNSRFVEGTRARTHTHTLLHTHTHTHAHTCARTHTHTLLHTHTQTHTHTHTHTRTHTHTHTHTLLHTHTHTCTHTHTHWHTHTHLHTHTHTHTHTCTHTHRHERARALFATEHAARRKPTRCIVLLLVCGQIRCVARPSVFRGSRPIERFPQTAGDCHFTCTAHIICVVVGPVQTTMHAC